MYYDKWPNTEGTKTYKCNPTEHIKQPINRGVNTQSWFVKYTQTLKCDIKLKIMLTMLIKNIHVCLLNNYPFMNGSQVSLKMGHHNLCIYTHIYVFIFKFI